MRIIDAFRGDHFLLSNFYSARLLFRGREFPTADHAFMSAKTTDERSIERIRTGAETASHAGRWPAEEPTLRAFSTHSESRSENLSVPGAMISPSGPGEDELTTRTTCSDRR